jgi:predicted lipoprotein with Yx(FWY)xxD motif
MRQIAALMSVLTVVCVMLPAQAKEKVFSEDYGREPMPSGFKVIVTEFEGPVFADAKGNTLYDWPRTSLRNGDAGEQKGKPTCDDHKYTDSAGLMSPYPPGLELPEVATRPSCADVWPPVLATPKDKPVGKWTILDRKDGRKQWAYDGYALYISVLDHGPGDVFGGSRMKSSSAEPGAQREPVGPPPDIPPQFAVDTVATGRLLVISDTGRSVYYSDQDSSGKSNCDLECLHDWAPVLAPETVHPQGEWSTVESSPGVKQWAFRKMPVYTRTLDSRGASLEGTDVPGWHNVYTQKAPPAPLGFTVNDTQSGQVLGDAQGMTVYVYNCNDDAIDQLACNHPDTPQEYRLAVCGRGDVELCLKNFPYVLAPRGTKSNSHIWSTMDIDPHTGKKAARNAPGGLHVWAYRDRPVYYCGRDKKPGDIECDAWGEFNGTRNGFKAFWLRDDFGGNAGSSRGL